MERMFSKIIKRDDVKKLMSEVINDTRYNDVNIPLPIENNYFINNNYALFLIMDALLKFDIIIDDYRFIEDYVCQLKRIMKRMNDYQDINKGINTLIGKTCGRKLNLNNYKSNDVKEKILRYIYKKYVVEGYFYYGFSSTYKNEIEYEGITKSGFRLDSRLDDVNNILKDYEKKDIIKRVESDITDNFVVASYFAFLGPDYLEKMANSGIFNDKCYDKSCFYTKNVNTFRNNLSLYCDKKHMKYDEKATVINNFLDTWNESMISNSHGCIAFIKRSQMNRNFLKDIEDIIIGSRDVDLYSSIAMIMESRYSSYELDGDISSLFFEIVDIPSYQYIIGEIEEEIEIIYDDNGLDDLKIIVEDQENNFDNKKEKFQNSNSYGFTSVFMLVGLLLISLGSTITIIIKALGR